MINFTKMHGLGNCYIYIDTSKNFIPENKIKDFTIYVSDRNFGIGSDGVILIEPSEIADFKMQIFNADGSEAEMCGNGIRCFSKYVYDNKLTDKRQLKIETLAGIKTAELIINEENLVEKVIVNMGKPSFENLEEIDKKVLNIDDKDLSSVIGTSVSMGNPHFVIFVDDVDNFDVEKYGKLVENHPYFPNKTNVEFIKVLEDGSVKMRVWERGSGETFACGTGACAVFATCNKLGLISNEATIHLRGGDLEFRIDVDTNEIFMTGTATTVCEGTINEIE